MQKRFFRFGARILRIGHFSDWKSKFFEVSSWHFKHPIKLNFLIWHLERPYPDKKSILEKRQFKSCPLSWPISAGIVRNRPIIIFFWRTIIKVSLLSIWTRGNDSWRKKLPKGAFGQKLPVRVAQWTSFLRKCEKFKKWMGFCVLKTLNSFFQLSWKEKTCLLSAANIEYKNFEEQILLCTHKPFLAFFTVS